jgi:hypothetical protein
MKIFYTILFLLSIFTVKQSWSMEDPNKDLSLDDSFIDEVLSTAADEVVSAAVFMHTPVEIQSEDVEVAEVQKRLVALSEKYEQYEKDRINLEGLVKKYLELTKNDARTYDVQYPKDCEFDSIFLPNNTPENDLFQGLLDASPSENILFNENLGSNDFNQKDSEKTEEYKKNQAPATKKIKKPARPRMTRELAALNNTWENYNKF